MRTTTTVVVVVGGGICFVRVVTSNGCCDTSPVAISFVIVHDRLDWETPRIGLLKQQEEEPNRWLKRGRWLENNNDARAWTHSNRAKHCTENISCDQTLQYSCCFQVLLKTRLDSTSSSLSVQNILFSVVWNHSVEIFKKPFSLHIFPALSTIDSHGRTSTPPLHRTLKKDSRYPRINSALPTPPTIAHHYYEWQR